MSNIESYPPIFRPTHIPELVNDPSDEPVDQPDLLPIIDVASLDESTLHVACTDWGIFRLVNHAIPEELIDNLQATAKSLFNLDFEHKRRLLTGPNPVYSWGNPALTPAGVQTPKGSPLTGLELISFKLADDDVNDEVTAFRNMLKIYGEHMARLTKRLFKSMVKNLALDKDLITEGNLSKYLDESSVLLRINRYPPYSTSETEAQLKGLDAHTDSSVLTILLQDDVHGLQFFKDGFWHPVKPIRNTLIVNLGDMSQAISDDEYKSVEHKVVLNKRRERISFGYFVFPEENTLVAQPNGKYKPFTCKDYRRQVQEDVTNIGWKVGLSRFRP